MASDGVIDLSQNARDEGDEDIGSQGKYLEIDMVPGLRSNAQLLYSRSEKMLYMKQHEYPDYTSYRCREKDCPSRVWLKPNNLCVKADKFKDHNHADNAELYKRLALRKQILDAATNKTNPASASIDSAVRHVNAT